MDIQGNGGSTPDLANRLARDLRCARCRHELRGLSVRAVCPECGLPVRATLLAVVDPRAKEFQPLFSPLPTAAGLLLWSYAALAAGLLVASLRIADAAALLGTPVRLPQFLPAGVAILAAVSAVGALALICPHRRCERRAVLMAGVGVLAYLPLTAALWRLHAWFDRFHDAPYFTQAAPDPDRSLHRLVIGVLLAIILICLRPAARELQARSLLMRTGRVTRQTMLAVLAALATAAVGDALHLLWHVLPPVLADAANVAGTSLIAGGSMLMLIGLAGMALDTTRLIPVLLEPPPTLGEAIKRHTEPDA